MGCIGCAYRMQPPNLRLGLRQSMFSTPTGRVFQIEWGLDQAHQVCTVRMSLSRQSAVHMPTKHDRACTPHPFRFMYTPHIVSTFEYPPERSNQRGGLASIKVLCTAHTLIACQARDGNRAGRMCGEDATCSSECAAGISSVYRYGSVITCREQGLVLSIHTTVRVTTDKRCQGFGRLSSVYSLILSSRESCDGAFVGARCRLYPCTALSGLYECG